MQPKYKDDPKRKDDPRMISSRKINEIFMTLTVRKVLVFPKNYSIYGFEIKTTKRIILQLSN